VEFIVVGGVAAVLNGAAMNTFDIDLVHARTPENIARILPVLEKIDAVFRARPDRKLRPDASHLRGSGELNLMTTMGQLDLLGTIGRGLTYEDLLPHSESMAVSATTTVRVLNLETLIALKEELNGEKDRIVLPLLRQVLKLKQTTEPSGSQGA
jgi:hypothetical protein